MVKWFNTTLVVASLAVILFPPWQVKWVDPATGIARFVPGKQEFAGFHSWGYTANPATKVIAWDGVNTGGKIEVKAKPSLNLSLFLLEIGVLGLLWCLRWFFGRHRDIAV